MKDKGPPSPTATTPPTAVEGPGGPIRLKWHKVRTRPDEAPFRLSNLTLGWKIGATLEIDILADADGRFVVLHDPTLGPSTTGRGRVAGMSVASMAGLFHRDGRGVADPDAPVLSLAKFLAQLKKLPRTAKANLQLDLKILEGRPLTDVSIADAADAVRGIADAITVGSHYLDEARRLVAAMPGARLGYDPMLAASRDARLRDPEILLRHMERRSEGMTLAYLRYDAVIAAERMGFPLVRRLLDLGIETDAWTVNPGPKTTDAVLRTLAEAKVRQITTDAPQMIADQIFNLPTLQKARRTTATGR